MAPNPSVVREKLHQRLALLLPNPPGVVQEGDPSGNSDEMDRAFLARAAELAALLGNGQRQTVRRIITAFHKLENGGYGLCDECAGRIGEQRLKAQPEAPLCIECQAAAEAGRVTSRAPQPAHPVMVRYGGLDFGLE